MAAESSTNQEIVEAYVEHVLALTLEAGREAVIDNLHAHVPARVRGLIGDRGCEVIYLLAYSPDRNPIEEAFAKIKDTLRQAGVRRKDAMVEVSSETLSAVSA